jgi:hypothetical protein
MPRRQNGGVGSCEAGIQTYALALSNELAIKRGLTPAEAALELRVMVRHKPWTV